MVPPKKRLQDSRLKNDLFKDFFDESAELIQSVDEKGTLIYTNKSWKKAMGYPKSSIGKLNFTEFIAKDQLKHSNYMFQKLMKGEHLSGADITFITKKGKKIHVKGSITPIIEDGKFIETVGVFRDITEKRLAEEALKISQERYQIVAEETGHLIYDYDIKSGRIEWAGALQEVLGYSPLGFYMDIKEWKKNIHPEDRKKVLKELVDAEKNASSYRRAYRFRKKDGSYAHIRDAGVFLKGNKGKIYRMLGVMNDVTEQVNTRERLVEEKNKIQYYINIAQVILLALDTDGKIVIINKKGREVLGIETEVMGKNWANTFIPKEARTGVKSLFKKMMKGDIQDEDYYENEVLTVKGEKRLIGWHNTLLRDRKGIIIGTLSSGDDITDRKKQEEKLKQQMDMLERFKESTVDQLLEFKSVEKENQRLKEELERLKKERA